MKFVRFVMVSKANHSHGPGLNMKMFNLGYAVGIIGILVVWNLIFLVTSVENENSLPFTQLCKATEEEHSSMAKKTNGPILKYMAVFLTICFIYVLLISKQTYKYLDSLNDDDLQSLPAQNILTFHDTKVLILMMYFAFMMYVATSLLEFLDLITLKTQINLQFLLKFIFGDVLFSFVHPIIIIRKTKKYLPQLWSDTNEVETMAIKNNDFYAWPTTENAQTNDSEISENPQNNQKTLRRHLNENQSHQHPFAIVAAEY